MQKRHLLFMSIPGLIPVSFALGNFSISSSATSETLVMPALYASSISCNGLRYGYDISLRSCVNALLRWSSSRHVETFGERDMGHFDVLLPQRIMSSKAFKASWVPCH